jgi:hypothetical protein
MSATLILGIAGSVTTLILLFELLRRKHLREKYAILWVLVAVMTLVVAAFPQTLFWLAGVLGVEVPANLLFFVASMVLLGISVHHSHELGRLEDQTRTLAEELALLRLKVDGTVRPSESPQHDERPRQAGS